jgi:hypothetical protein
MVFVCSQACAELVTATFEGPVTTIYMPAGNPFTYDGTVMMQLVITYDSASPDVYPLPDPNRAIYRGIHSVNLSVRDPGNTLIYSASSTGSGSGGVARFVLHNDDPFEEDGVITYEDTLTFLDLSPATSEHGTLTGPDIMGMPLWMVDLGGIDYEGAALSSDAMPTSFTPAIDWDHFGMLFYWRHGTYNTCIQATELTATTSIVPLPGALPLASLGMATAGWLLRRRPLRCG